MKMTAIILYWNQKSAKHAVIHFAQLEVVEEEWLVMDFVEWGS